MQCSTSWTIMPGACHCNPVDDGYRSMCLHELWIETSEITHFKLYWTWAEALSFTTHELKVPTIEEKNHVSTVLRNVLNKLLLLSRFLVIHNHSRKTTAWTACTSEYLWNHKNTKHNLIDYSTRVMTKKIVQTTALISCRIMYELWDLQEALFQLTSVNDYRWKVLTVSKALERFSLLLIVWQISKFTPLIKTFATAHFVVFFRWRSRGGRRRWWNSAYAGLLCR